MPRLWSATTAQSFLMFISFTQLSGERLEKDTLDVALCHSEELCRVLFPGQQEADPLAINVSTETKRYIACVMLQMDFVNFKEVNVEKMNVILHKNVPGKEMNWRNFDGDVKHCVAGFDVSKLSSDLLFDFFVCYATAALKNSNPTPYIPAVSDGYIVA